jgi:hypothetical protein
VDGALLLTATAQAHPTEMESTMKQSTKAKKTTSTKTKTTLRSDHHDGGDTKAPTEPKSAPKFSDRFDRTTVEGARAAEEASDAAEKATSDARRAVLAEQITALIAEYDAIDANFVGVRDEVADFLMDLEGCVIRATGYIGTAKYDECGPGKGDLDDAMRELAAARGSLAATRIHLEGAGVLAAQAKAVAS